MLRPISFSALSSTQLKISFNKDLSDRISSENFSIKSVDGNADTLEVLSVEVTGPSVIIKTRPQISGNYYILHMIDSDEVLFKSSDNSLLINDDVSRELYFVGINNRNPVRDDLYQNAPSLYSLRNSNVSKLIDNTAEEIYKAQKHIGEVLSDNYISEQITDEIRVRASGATDRLSNENVYSIDRVSKRASFESQKSLSIEFGQNYRYLMMESFPGYPVSLQQEYIEEEEVSVFSEENSFKNFVLTLKNKNILSVKEIIYIKSGSEPNCDESLGKKYRIDLYKYSIRDNKYDPDLSFSNIDLDSNQVMLSELGNIPRPSINDKFLVSYFFKNKRKNINSDSVDVYNINLAQKESVPSNITRFYLKNSQIVDDNNETPEVGGVLFSKNNSESRSAFRKELPFDSSKLPSNTGEYSVNYSTGEVIVVGARNIGEGTGSDIYSAKYLYKNSFIQDLDFYIEENDIVGAIDREMVGSELKIDALYEEVYVEGEDYLSMCHIEEINEHVENNLSSSFSFITKNSPITDVFRIVNQTTGEIYNPLYFTEKEVFFSGKRSPEIKEFSENFSPAIVQNEKLTPYGQFVSPAFSVKIKTSLTNSNILFSPGIPSELIDASSTKYFIRSTGLSGDDAVEDIEIRYFGEPNSNGIITSLGISPTAQPPSLGESVFIGPAVFSFSLENKMISAGSGDFVGSFLNSSVLFSDENLFLNEKYYKNIGYTPSQTRLNQDSFLSEISFDEEYYKNLSRLRLSGDYLVDYSAGKVYLAVNDVDRDNFGLITYSHNKSYTDNQNVISCTDASRKINPYDSTADAQTIYDKVENDNNSISVLDLESSLSFFNRSFSPDNSGELELSNIILDDYTIVLENKIRSINTILEPKHIFGKNILAEDSSERYPDLSSRQIFGNPEYNLFDASKNSFSSNVVDLKRYFSTRVLESNGYFTININDSDADKIYKVIYEPTGQELFDEKLNVNKISNLDIVASLSGGGETYAEIRSGTILEKIDIEQDYLLDSDGARFLITGVDDLRSRIYVASPAVNRPDATTPSIGASSVVNKVSVTYNDGIQISIPSDSIVQSLETITVQYISKNTPKIGSEVVVSYDYGSVYLSYKYCYDDLYVSYEYGDNEVDWSISSAIKEGEQYFVSYKFGALRNALRDNFGVLTKIPYFQKFGLNVNREVYRSALKAVMKSFSRGPIKESFEGIVKAFTGTNPEITETAFNSWILGRNLLEPEKISVDGPIQFLSSKHSEGIYAQDGTVLKTPAISNINVSEGTFSSWITPQWDGIDNDATLTVEIDNLQSSSFRYQFGTDITSGENGFSIFAEKDGFNLIDSTGYSVTLDNSLLLNVDGVESTSSTRFALSKNDPLLTRANASSHNIQLSIEKFSLNYISTLLGEFYGPNSEGYGKYGKYIDFKIIDNFGLNFISVEDGQKSVFMPISIEPVLDSSDLESPVILSVSESNLDSFDLPEYTRPHKTIGCSCSIKDTIEELSGFRDNLQMDIRVDFDSSIDLGYLAISKIAIDDDSGPFFLIDENDQVFKVSSFIEEGGRVVNKNIPSKIAGVYLNRFPINKENYSSLGSDFINKIGPSGLCALTYSSVSILLNQKNTSSKEFFEFKEKSLIVDVTKKLDVYIEREPVKNIVKLKVGGNLLKIFYTDLLHVESKVIKDLPKSRENINCQLSIGTANKQAYVSLDIHQLSYNIDSNISLNDIYIGKNAISPDRTPFKISRDMFKEISMPPYNLEQDDGVFIWYDPDCTNRISESTGNWIFRTKIQEKISVPSSVIKTSTGYIFGYQNIDNNLVINGRITTDGEFSSVERSHKKDDALDCYDGVICSSKYRYCGDGNILKSGWSKINETSSTLINTIIGGSSNDRSTWASTNDIKSLKGGGATTLGPSAEHDLHNGNNSIFTNMPCYGGNYNYEISFKVDNFSLSNLPTFDGDISGSLVGITPVHIFDGDINFKLTLGITSSNQPCVLIYDCEANEVVDIAPLDWTNDFCTLIVKKIDSEINIESKSRIISRLSVIDFSEVEANYCSFFSEPSVAFTIFDSDIINNKSFHSSFEGNSVKISFAELTAAYIEGDSLIDDKDVLISTDSKIEFSFNALAKEGDGYFDGYFDGYLDGYISSPTFDIDEIKFSSDRLRYLFDTGESESKNRISLFKDGKGFLNFRIFDNGFQKSGHAEVYNVAKNIKDFRAGEVHHIAASWRLNSLFEKDEMHLFVDGLEVPNIFKFGGKIKAKINNKFSDIGIEVLQDFKNDFIKYYPKLNDGTISAGSSTFYSKSMKFTSDMIGRSVIFYSSNIAEKYIGEKYVFGNLAGNGITILNAETLFPIEFNVSAKDIKFSLAPTAGIKKKINTDLINSKYSISIDPCDKEESEVGGIKYEILNGEIIVHNNNKVINPKYRINLTYGLIEFVHINSECNWMPSVNISDLNIYIKTFGLMFRGVNEIVSLSSSSYLPGPSTITSAGRGAAYDFNLGGKSVFMSHAVKPVSLNSVSITKIIKERYIPEVSTESAGSSFAATFVTSMNSKNKLSSQSQIIEKKNSGRFISLVIDSDNIIFCNNPEDGYIDGYGFSSNSNSITVYGNTLDGSGFETFTIDKNGKFDGKKIFFNVTSIEGSLNIADDYYEPCVLELLERDSITVQNNNGEFAEIFDYVNGSFIISSYGSSGKIPFELLSGAYRVKYPSFLNIKIPTVGRELFFGSDLNGKNSANAILDSLRILTEMSSDTRPYERLTSGTRSITRDYMSPNPPCADKQTLLLSSLDNPIDLQSRRLRQKEFLNSDMNFKFKLDQEDRENLLQSINVQSDFESKMLMLGFDLDDAKKTFVECHHADGGPIFNDARLIRDSKMLVSQRSVNENFGLSATFIDRPPVIINNDLSFFRKNEGTIEFWISPILDTINDNLERYYIDICSAEKVRAKSSDTKTINLPSSAGKLLGVRLLTRRAGDSKFYSKKEEDSIIFDEIYRSEISGILEGGSGFEKDFSEGAVLSPDGRSVFLKKALPSVKCDVIVSYIPLNSNGERISIYKNENSQLIFSIKNKDENIFVGADIDWKKNSWHRIKCVYRANSSNDAIKMFIDGVAGDSILYGESGLRYGSGKLYGESPNTKNSIKAKKIVLKDDFRVISVGGSSLRSSPALARLDNIRFSRKMRDNFRLSSGESVDFDYYGNKDSALPVQADDKTTLILDFNGESDDPGYAQVVDPSRGVFNFDIDVYDEFSKINDEDIEDLITDLVNILKPSHTNALVKFPRNPCK